MATAGRPARETRATSLVEYWTVLRKRWILFLVAYLSVVVTAVVHEANRPPTFSSFVDILISPEPPSEQVRNLQPAQRARISDMNFSYYVDHARSEACVAEVIAQGALGPVPPPKTAEWFNLFERVLAVASADRLPERRIVRIAVRGGDPEFVFRLANAFGPAYVTSLTESLISANRKMETYIDEEIRRAENEITNYRAVVARLERVLGGPDEPAGDPTLKPRLEAARRLLKERAAAIDAASDTIEAGGTPSLEEMEIAITGLFSAIPPEFAQDLAGAGRDQLEAARVRWAERLKTYKSLSRTLTDLHPDKATARQSLLESSIELIQQIAVWYRIADAHLAGRIAAVAEPAREEPPESLSSLIGESIVASPLALSRYKAEIELRQSLMGDLLRKKSLLKLERSGQEKMAEWIRPAARPSAPNNPQLTRGLIMGSAIGILVAFAAVFIVEALDSSIKTPGSAEEILGKRVIGVVPCFSDPESSRPEPSPARLVVRIAPVSPEAEAYRSLAHKIDVQPHRFLVITSTGPQEGKSTTSANLSAAIAELGRRVLLVSANLRRPTLHRIFDVPEAPGLAEMVRDEATLESVVKTTVVPNLDILVSGNLAETSIASAVSSPLLLTRLRETLARRYDFIIVDVPPSAPVSDALSFARNADAVLLVYMVGRASEVAVAQVIRSIEDVGGKIIGIIMNDVKGIGQAYGYHYADRYYHYTREGPVM